MLVSHFSKHMYGLLSQTSSHNICAEMCQGQRGRKHVDFHWGNTCCGRQYWQLTFKRAIKYFSAGRSVKHAYMGVCMWIRAVICHGQSRKSYIFKECKLTFVILCGIQTDDAAFRALRSSFFCDELLVADTYNATAAQRAPFYCQNALSCYASLGLLVAPLHDIQLPGRRVFKRCGFVVVPRPHSGWFRAEGPTTCATKARWRERATNTWAGPWKQWDSVGWSAKPIEPQQRSLSSQSWWEPPTLYLTLLQIIQSCCIRNSLEHFLWAVTRTIAIIGLGLLPLVWAMLKG